MEFPAYVDAWELHRGALKEGIGITPGQIFSATNQFNNYIRLNYCSIWNTRVDKHLEKLELLIINYQAYNIKS
jgi:DNA-binding transcriptional MocR family regulator